MRQADAYAVMTDEEKLRMEEEWNLDVEYFNSLKIKNLVSRHIRGEIAKFYNVRVGCSSDGTVSRHYYPRYSQGAIIGAKCRTLPKDFTAGTLGRTWGAGELFGQNTLQDVLNSGRRKDTLILVGGECDAMAAQQILLESQKGTQWEGKFFHVWSPMKGEHCIQEILDNKEEIAKFKKILVAFDADETGEKLNKDVARLFRGKAMKLQYPSGCKDANSCLVHSKGKEFVDAFFNPVEVFGGGKLKC
jgi:twinkle protein